MSFEKGKTPEGAKPFQPGQSGNPNGRPMGSKNRSTIARQWLGVSTTHEHPVTKAEEDMSFEDAITLHQINRALSGDTNAYKAVLDSAYGAPKQAVEHTGEDGGPMRLQADYSTLTDDELNLLRSIRTRLRGGE